MISVAVQPNLNSFFKGYLKLKEYKEFELFSVYSLNFVCKYVVRGVILISPA